MADLPPNFWSRSIATITGCVVAGALIGLVVGLLADNIGRFMMGGILAGAIASVLVVYLLGERRGGGD